VITIQSTNVTDVQTDGRHAIATALGTSASRGRNADDDIMRRVERCFLTYFFIKYLSVIYYIVIAIFVYI